MKQHIGATLLSTIDRNLLTMSTRRHYERGDFLKRAGEPFNSFCILESGTVKLIYEDAELPSVIIDLYHAGDFFGEMEAIKMRTEDRSIIALTPCELYEFTSEQFFLLWNTCNAFSRYIFSVVCDRLLRSGNDKIHTECMVLREKVFRIIQENLSESNYFLYTKDILAEMAGTSIRSLNRALAELKELKLISISSGTIRLRL